MSTRPGLRPGTPLSRAETTVLTLVAAGLTYPEIGKRLFITVNTVRSHIENCRLKLGARDRLHAVVLAHRTGQIDLGGPATTAVARTRQLAADLRTWISPDGITAHGIADQIDAALDGVTTRSAA